MEIVTSTVDHQEYLDDLSKGEFHLVTFAMNGTSKFAAALESLGIGENEITTICEQINQSEETGTLWPIAKTTAIPKKFSNKPLGKQRGLQACIRDAFIANRDYCKSHRRLFDFTDDVSNSAALEDKISQLAMGKFNCAPLTEVEIWFDKEPKTFVF